MYEIKVGSKLYRKVWDQIKEVKVYEIFLEAYMDGYKTIIKVLDENNKIIYTHFASDLDYKLLTELPKDVEEGKSE